MREHLSSDHAQTIAQAACNVPGVAGLSDGLFGEVSLLFPRQRVQGLRLVDKHTLEIHLIADLKAVEASGGSLPALASAVRAAVSQLTELKVDVIVTDATTQSATTQP